MMDPLPDRLPLVIGVTGHRDLREEDLPRIEREVSSIINNLRRDFLANDGETPIVVLSALAEGADRLVARAAIAQGVRLIAPLPMPPWEYRRDFATGSKDSASVAEFDQLLAQAIAAPVMPFTRGNSLEAVRSDPKKRAEQYRAVGLFIVQHCNVLIALWDGDERDMAVGGTAEVVTFKRHGIPLTVTGSARASLDASEIGPVIHVVTPRRKAASPAVKVSVNPWGRYVIQRYRGGMFRRISRAICGFVARIFWREFADVRSFLSDEERSELERWEIFEALIALTRRFNRESALLAATTDGPMRMARNLDYLFGKSDTEPNIDPTIAKQRALKQAPRWCRMYAIADTLAQEWQTQFKRDWLLLFSCGLFAFVCFALFSHSEVPSGVLPILYCLYSLSFIVIFLLFSRARIGQHQERFLDYRALAEALRVAVYWKLVGIGSLLSDARADAAGSRSIVDAHTLGVLANAYPIKQPNELAWVKICLRTLELLDRAERRISEQRLDSVGHNIARYFWVRGQYFYFRRQGFRHNRKAENLETDAIVISALSPFLIVPLLLAFTSPPTDGHQSDLGLVLIMFSGLLPVFAAVLSGYSERLAFKAQARQYDRMRMLFERAWKLLPEQIDEESSSLAQALYAELGAEAMKENADWVAIYRQRPVQPMQ
jgi:hypothetical protein